MGPPARPADRHLTERSGERQARDLSADMNSLTDVMFGTGVDLKAEEAAMMASYRDSQQSQSFHSHNSQTSSTLTPNNSFDAARSFSLPSSGVLSQTASQQRVEDEVAAEQKRTARIFNERQQAPLYNPFLQIDVLRQIVQRKAYENGVKTNVEGLFVRTQGVRTTVMNGQNGTGGIVKAQTGSWITEGAPLVDVLALLTLAASERIRTLADDAYGLARGRQASSDGIVDPDWAAMAVGQGAEGTASRVSLSVTNTAWDRPEVASSPTTSRPAKRPLEDTNGNSGRLPTPPTEPPLTPRPTKTYPNRVASALRAIAQRDLEAERARLAARSKRQKAAAAALNGDSGSSPATPSSAAPGTPGGGIAPDGPLTLSKKQQDKLKKQQQNDVNELNKNSNDVARLALGGSRKYSWMTGGAAAKPSPNPISRINTSVGGVTSPAAASPGRAAASGPGTQLGLKAKDRKYGEWREDGTLGAGIQVRDLVHVLEQDGRSKKSLVKVLSNLSSTERVGDAEHAEEQK